MISSIITKFVAKQMAKSKGVIANKKAVEFSSAAMEDRLMRNGFDPNAIKSESELLAVLNSIKQKENLAFQREFKDIFTRKDAKVFDLQGNKIDTSKPIMGGKNIPETEEQFLTRIQKENKESAERLREKKDIKVEDTKLTHEELENRQNRLIRERDEMGPVNLRAEIEMKELEQQISNILLESEDLQNAIDKLRLSVICN